VSRISIAYRDTGDRNGNIRVINIVPPNTQVNNVEQLTKTQANSVNTDGMNILCNVRIEQTVYCYIYRSAIVTIKW
jgi:hypothetical protein